MTSWPRSKPISETPGGEWVDQEVVVDGNLVTSRKPDDIPAFNRELLNCSAREGWPRRKFPPYTYCRRGRMMLLPAMRRQRDRRIKMLGWSAILGLAYVL